MKKLIFLCFVFLGLQAGDYYGSKVFPPANNALYQKECASCHFGYQPGLLPTSSWQYVMQNLQNHYGTDASLDEEDVKAILDYLVANASERSNNKRSRKITRSLQAGVVYTSITEIPYFQRKHRKIPQHLINQKEVKSLARCSACHQEANQGIYNDDTVKIPNYGYWRD